MSIISLESKKLLRADKSILSPGQIQAMLITACILISLYLLLLVWTLYNVKVYLWDQKRYKTFSVLIFYILALILESSRMLMYFNVIYMDSSWDNSLLLNQYYIYNACYDIALFTKVIMGFF